MLTTLARSPARISIEERMKQFGTWVTVFGYRAPTKADLVAGAELIMVDVERYMEHHQGVSFTAICGTRITLDDEPVQPSKADSTKEVIYYHCTMPPWDGQCFVGLEDMTTLGYRNGCYDNDTRWLIKR